MRTRPCLAQWRRGRGVPVTDWPEQANCQGPGTPSLKPSLALPPQETRPEDPRWLSRA